MQPRLVDPAPSLFSCGIRGVCLLCCCGLLAAGVTGCGKSDNSGKSDADAAVADAPDEAAAGEKSSSSGKKSKKGKGAAGPRIGEIPKDAWPEVFFENPLEVAAEKSPTSAGDAGGTPSADTAAKPPANEIPQTNGSKGNPTTAVGDDWAGLISDEVIVAEVKEIRNNLTANLASAGKFGGKFKDVKYDAATMAALAGIVIDHPAAPSWKENAKYIRDVSAEMVKASTANGDKYYKPTRAAYDKLDALFSGSKPPQLAEAAERVKFSELGGRVPLMYRMERAFNFMKLQVNTEAIFKKETGRLEHEGGVLAALAKVVAMPDYDDADIDEYQQFARELQRCGLGVVEAVKADDFKAYQAAIDRGFKACNDCHGKFKNE